MPLLGALCASSLLNAGAAWAGDCSAQGSATASALRVAASPDARESFGDSLELALADPASPAQTIGQVAAACRRGTFKAGADTYTLFGDDGSALPRWARGPDPARIAYLVRIPDPMQALAWRRGRHARNETPSFDKYLYALVVTDAGRRLVYEFRRETPDDYRLALAMRAALEGRWTPVAVVDTRNAHVDVTHLDLAGTLDAAAIFSAAPGPRPFPAPDGQIFRPQSDGGALHAASGLVCPARVGPYARTDFAVFDATEGGRDVMCRFFTDKSWLSVFETKFPGRSFEEVFAGYLRDAHNGSPAAGPLAPPGDVRSTLPLKAEFWRGQEGALQALWLVKKGDWFLEVRATYQPGQEAAVAAFAQTILDQVAAACPVAAPICA